MSSDIFIIGLLDGLYVIVSKHAYFYGTKRWL